MLYIKANLYVFGSEDKRTISIDVHPTGVHNDGRLGMADECLRYHSRLAELLSAKKQESYAITISWVRAKVSFAIWSERAPMPKRIENPEKEELRR